MRIGWPWTSWYILIDVYRRSIKEMICSHGGLSARIARQLAGTVL